MRDFVLVFDQNLPEEDQNSFFEKLEVQPQSKLSFDQFNLQDYSSKDNILFWVSDEQSKKIIEEANENSPSIAFLPHPELILIAKSLGVASSLATPRSPIT